MATRNLIRVSFHETAPMQNRRQKVSQAHFGMGGVIFREGDAADHAYVIDSGRVEVSRGSNGGQKTLTVLQWGDCFGEIALLSDSSCTTTVKCLTAVEVTVPPRDQFLALAERYRELGNALRSSMNERMEVTMESSWGHRIDQPCVGATGSMPSGLREAIAISG